MALTEPILLADVKTFLRVDSSADDTFITLLISRARVSVEQRAGISLVEKTYIEKFHDFPAFFAPKYKPLQSVTSIQYVDVDGETQTLAADQYVVDYNDLYRAARIYEADGVTWPNVQDVNPEAVTLTYVAYLDSDDDIENDALEALKQAVLLTIADWYENRNNAAAVVNSQADAIIDMFRATV